MSNKEKWDNKKWDKETMSQIILRKIMRDMIKEMDMNEMLRFAHDAEYREEVRKTAEARAEKEINDNYTKEQ